MIIGGAATIYSGYKQSNSAYILREYIINLPQMYFFQKLMKHMVLSAKEFRQHDEKNKYDMTFYIYERE